MEISRLSDDSCCLVVGNENKHKCREPRYFCRGTRSEQSTAGPWAAISDGRRDATRHRVADVGAAG